MISHSTGHCTTSINHKLTVHIFPQCYINHSAVSLQECAMPGEIFKVTSTKPWSQPDKSFLYMVLTWLLLFFTNAPNPYWRECMVHSVTVEIFCNIKHKNTISWYTLNICNSIANGFHVLMFTSNICENKTSQKILCTVHCQYHVISAKMCSVSLLRETSSLSSNW